jgi:hypothetical protein
LPSAGTAGAPPPGRPGPAGATLTLVLLTVLPR